MNFRFAGRCSGRPDLETLEVLEGDTFEEVISLVRSRIALTMNAEECRKYLRTDTCPPWP